MDKENTGHIKLNELMVSLKSSDQIKLSKAQVFKLIRLRCLHYKATLGRILSLM